MNSSELAQRLGVDEETVESILRLGGAQEDAEGLPTTVQGFASCINQACERFNEDRPITINIERVVQTYKDLGGNLSFVDRDTEHFAPQNDADLICPDCHQPCSLIPGQRRVIPNHTRSMMR